MVLSVSESSDVKAEHALPTVELDNYLPEYQFSDSNSEIVPGHPEDVYSRVRHLDLARIPTVRALFWIRTAPQRLWRRSLDSRPLARTKTITIDDIVAPGSGFKILHETPGTGVVVGSVGKFWDPRISHFDFDPERFRTIEEPGYGKVAWNVHVTPHGADHARVSIEVRVYMPDEKGLKWFRRYWRTVGPFSRWIRGKALRRLRKDLETGKLEDVRSRRL